MLAIVAVGIKNLELLIRVTRIRATIIYVDVHAFRWSARAQTAPATAQIQTTRRSRT